MVAVKQLSYLAVGVGVVAVMQLSYPGVGGSGCGCEAAVISGSWG